MLVTNAGILPRQALGGLEFASSVKLTLPTWSAVWLNCLPTRCHLGRRSKRVGASLRPVGVQPVSCWRLLSGRFPDLGIGIKKEPKGKTAREVSCPWVPLQGSRAEGWAQRGHGWYWGKVMDCAWGAGESSPGQSPGPYSMTAWFLGMKLPELWEDSDLDDCLNFEPGTALWIRLGQWDPYLKFNFFAKTPCDEW